MIRTRELPIQERMTLYNEAMQLRKHEGLGGIEIGKRLGVTRKTVDHWLYENTNPRNLQNGTHQPNLNPSPELSFIIGTVLSDGCISINKWKRKSAKQIILGVKDLDFAEAFNQKICCLLNKKASYSMQTTKENYFRVVACSTQLYDFLNNDLTQLKPCIEQFPSDFLGALIDGDGSVSMGSPHRHCIRIYSTDKELLSFCQQLLENKMTVESKLYSYDERGRSHSNIKGRAIVAKKIIYRLQIHKRDALLNLWHNIKLTIKRKQDRLDKIAQNILGCKEVKEWS